MARPRRGRRENERGSVVVIVAAAMVAIFGLAALGTDVGRLFVEKQRLSGVADAAVLAAVTKLPGDAQAAVATMNTYLSKNNIDPATATVQVSSDHTQISVTMAQQVDMTFARVIGIRQSPVAAGATALIAPISGMFGAVPLGVPRAAWNIGQQVSLKLDSHSGSVAPGNYQALALGKSGASSYEANLTNGYQNWIRVNQWVETETGNMAGPTARAVNNRISADPTVTYLTATRQSPRLVKVPVLRDYEVNGRGEVLVVGFAIFFLEGATDSGGGKGEIVGRFVSMISEGEANGTAPDLGLYAIKLVQ
ncbi:MAG TPA: pilus assembly protein TadG-related protein [Symbiobacteriaceae bacterium]|nr:pilus assembly protein TadG-related protein [Symbiobacteriaceae bacterium]